MHALQQGPRSKVIAAAKNVPTAGADQHKAKQRLRQCAPSREQWLNVGDALVLHDLPQKLTRLIVPQLADAANVHAKPCSCNHKVTRAPDLPGADVGWGGRQVCEQLPACLGVTVWQCVHLQHDVDAKVAQADAVVQRRWLLSVFGC